MSAITELLAMSAEYQSRDHPLHKHAAAEMKRLGAALNAEIGQLRDQLTERDAMIGWLRDALEDAATTFAGIYMKRESSDLPPYTDAYYCDLCGEDWSTSDNCPACKIARLSKLASGDAEEAEAAR